MEKRKYTHIKAVEAEILSMRAAGKTRREIAESLGLEKEQIKAWITRYNRRQEKIAAGIPIQKRGRPRKRSLSKTEEYEKEIARLQMENKLLRDFLELRGRK